MLQSQRVVTVQVLQVSGQGHLHYPYPASQEGGIGACFDISHLPSIGSKCHRVHGCCINASGNNRGDAEGSTVWQAMAYNYALKLSYLSAVCSSS